MPWTAFSTAAVGDKRGHRVLSKCTTQLTKFTTRLINFTAHLTKFTTHLRPCTTRLTPILGRGYACDSAAAVGDKCGPGVLSKFTLHSTKFTTG